MWRWPSAHRIRFAGGPPSRGGRQAVAGESAIIVPVQVPVAVGRLRDRMDPSAAQGVPAHVTLLYPFMPPEALK